MTVLTLQPDAASGVDAFIYTGGATTNFGSNVSLAVGRLSVDSQIYRSLIKFDLSSVPSDAVISSAVLSLMVNGDYSTNAETISVYRVIRAWTEAGVTWIKYDGAVNWQTVGGFGALDCEQTPIGATAFAASETVGVFKDFALTPTTKAGLDLGNGWLIKADAEAVSNGYGFHSSDAATAGNRPRLVITYSTPTPKGLPVISHYHHAVYGGG